MYSKRAITKNVKDVSAQKLFHIYVSKFPRKAISLRKHMALGQTTEQKSVVQAEHWEPRGGSQLATLDENN